MAAETAQPVEKSHDNAIAAAVRDVRALFDSGNYVDALDTCESLLARHGDCAEALLLLGLISFELEEPQRALTLLARAHEKAPEIREYADALACVAAQLGDDTMALYYAKLASIQPAHPLGEALLPERYGKFFESLGNAKPNAFRKRAERLLDGGDAPAALAACEKQLALSPNDADSWRLLARAALEAGDIARAVAACEFLSHDTLAAGDHDVLARALATVGDFDGAERAHAEAIAAAPDDPALAQSRIRTLAARYGNAGGHLARANREWVARHTTAPPARRARPRARSAEDHPLRVGYIGGALHAGPLAEVLTPILAAHDARRVLPYCYATNLRYDAASETIARHAARWTDIRGVDPATVGEILRNDGIDIAVDLTGHGPGSQLPVFAQQPVPVCVSWLGAALPAGAGFDYLLASETLMPPGDGAVESACTVYRLPATHLAYRPLDAPQAVTPLPARQKPHLTIGVMAPLAELGEACVGDWRQILAALGNARLLIANVARLDGAAVQRLYDLSAAAGIRERIDIAELDAVDPAGYGFFDHFDILLDPQPNSRFLETCRSLWMGVPVLAIGGAGPAGRQAAAALAAAERPEWVFADNAARLAGIRQLVADLGRLAEVRASLRESVARTALFDVTAFTRTLEDAYRAM